MFKNRILLFHLLTALVVTIWGTTFVSTKVLLQHGLNPIEIMFYRFVLAYVCILLVSHKRIWADNWKDETMLMLAGLTGGTFYFIAENTALEITQASNVALLVCTTPIFTSLFMHWLYKEPLRSNVMIGSLIALVGVGMVVFSGSVILQINPLGDFLSIVASMMWAFYCLVAFRKPLFYGFHYPESVFVQHLVFVGLFPFPSFAGENGYIVPAGGVTESSVLGSGGFHDLFHRLECSGKGVGTFAYGQLYLCTTVQHFGAFFHHSFRGYHFDFDDWCGLHHWWSLFGRKELKV